MKIRLARRIYPAFIAITVLLLLGVSACTSESDDDSQEAAPPNHPDAATAMAATGQAVQVSEEVVSQFAADQQAINEEWDRFHGQFDSWRKGLTACDRTAALEALRVFAADFGAITEQARDLPGKGIARELPDNVILAANNEETALRLLRDNWQPGNPDLLENSQTERGNASNLLRMTSVEVDKLDELDKPEDQAVAEDFEEALGPVENAWEQFYDSFENLEDDYIDLTLPQIVTRLRALVEEHEAVLESLEAIPSDKVTDPVHDQLVGAAETESEALEDLLDAFRRIAKAESEGGQDEGEDQEQNGDGDAGDSGDTSNGPDSETSDDSDAGAGNAPQGSAQGQPSEGLAPGDSAPVEGALTQGSENGPAGPVPPVPFFGGGETRTEAATPPGGANGSSAAAGTDAGADFSEHFDVFEDTLDETRVARKQAGRELDALIEGVSEEDKEALAEFTNAFADLMDDWDDFHQEFDQWVRTEGDCDRADAVNELNQFNQSFSVLTTRVRELSQAAYLRPSSDLLSEAVDREGAALRSLASTWAPYESDVYRGLDEERANSLELRRLADRRTQEVMERHGMAQ